MTAATIPNFGPIRIIGFAYDGTFPLDFLEADELVRSTNGEGYCVIESLRGHVRVRPDDFISRREDGSLFVSTPTGCEHCSCATHGEAACCHCDYAPRRAERQELPVPGCPVCAEEYGDIGLVEGAK